MIKAPNTICLSFHGNSEMREIATALLAEIGFYAFEESDDSLRAFINESDFNSEEAQKSIGYLFTDGFSTEIIPPKDWNEEWEMNFKGIVVDDFCEIVPPFREPLGGTKHVLKIHPKMAFGTGHHSTTQLMILQCRNFDFAGKRVLDMGTGTGILGILAEKLGALSVIAIDNDAWSAENAPENAYLNGCTQFKMIGGDVNSIPGSVFDIIFANINRNILIEDGGAYFQHLATNGVLFVSGFFDFDKNIILNHFLPMGMECFSDLESNGWISLGLRKN